MVIRASVWIVASVAALAVSGLATKSSKKQKKPNTVTPEDDSTCQEERQIEEIKKQKIGHGELEDWGMQEEKQPDNSTAKTVGDLKQSSHETTDNGVRHVIKELEHRKHTLESKLFELYVLKEEYMHISQLRSQLKGKILEANDLNLAVDSLQAETRYFKEEIREIFLAENQLKLANRTVWELHEKMDLNANRMKGQVMMLEEQVSRIQKRSERYSNGDARAQKRIKDFNEVEFEVFKIKRKNKELELEKRELGAKLNAAHAQIATVSRMTEGQVIGRVTKEVGTLKSVNEELQKQVERLQKDRFSMVEELVYQRWLNCCLRFEIQSDQILKSSSPKSQTSEKSSSSIDSTITGSSSLSIQSSKPKKQGLVQKLKKWGKRSKTDDPSPRNILKRRLSTSILPSRTLTETPSFTRPRRVSFNDIVRKLEYQSEEPSETTSMEEEEHSGAAAVSSGSCKELLESYLANMQVASNFQTVEECTLSTEVATAGDPIAMATQSQNRVEVPQMQLVAAFFVLIFVLLVLLQVLHLLMRQS